MAVFEAGGFSGAFVGSGLLAIVFVVALATGIGIAEGALDGFVGATVGFVLMVLIVVVLLAVATSLTLFAGMAQSGGEVGSSGDEAGLGESPAARRAVALAVRGPRAVLASGRGWSG